LEKEKPENFERRKKEQRTDLRGLSFKNFAATSFKENLLS
jgi:hypothetical protein